MRRPLFFFVLATIGAAGAFAQSAPSANPSDGLELLKKVAQQYAEADSYYIESVEERTSTGEYDRSWLKTVLIVAEAPGDRSYYEGRSNSGSAIRVSDGKNVWTYRVNEHRYTVKPLPVGTSSQSMVAISEEVMMQAKNLKKKWSNLVKSVKSAELLPDAALMVDGHQVLCKVVHIQTSDFKRVSDGYTETIWIDAMHETVLKTVEQGHNYMINGAAHIPFQEEILTTFTTILNGPVRENLFTFAPPADAKLMQDFPDPSHDSGGPNITGEQVPALKFKSADGKVVSIESFRGKPVLVDLWATWCGPCVQAMPQLAQINAEAKDKGLVLLLVDEDEEAPTATAFLSKKGYSWTDFHDGDGEIEKLVGQSAIPRTILIDAQGKITYDAIGTDGDQLRIAIAKLGPEYAALAPKPKPAPCAACK
jgi:thiol-disulfide isomerase/thioredoxin/outer membrane lipoprotein-sorting protein